ncbi:MAG: amidohydrolase [bacterium]
MDPVKRIKYFFNANILMMDGTAPRAPHMLIADGRIWACCCGSMPLGLDSRVSGFGHARRQYADDIDFIDLKGATVIPGLSDAHIHFMWWAVSQTRAGLGNAATEENAIALLEIFAAHHAQGEWILGVGWSHNTWPDGRLPSLDSLDRMFPNNPVFLSSKCGHLAWVNSAALSAAGIDDSTADPPGGQIVRVRRKRRMWLTGILKENAIWLVEKHISAPSPRTMLDAFERGQHKAHMLGLASMHTPEDIDTFAFLQRMRVEGRLRLRINFIPPCDALDALAELKVSAGFGDEWLRICAVKMFADGSLGGRTALMYEALEGEPSNTGICVSNEEELVSRIGQSNRLGLPAAIHAIGDRAVGNVLRALDKAVTDGDSSPSTMTAMKQNRIEHLQLYSPDDLELMRRLRPIASMQPIHLCADMGPADQYWGKRNCHAYAFKTIADAGCVLAFGSDGPVESINPFRGVYAAATRMNLQGEPGMGWHPEERISVMEALSAYTRGAAIAAGQADCAGSLSPGRFADFVVLDADPTAIACRDLLDLQPISTWINGECVFSRQDGA